MTNDSLQVYTSENAIKWNSNGGADFDVSPWIVNRVAELSRDIEVDLLDVGSGTGRWTKQFAQYVDSVVGVDLSSEMIGIARKTNPAYNVKYIHGDFLNLSFGGFKIVTALASLQHFKTRKNLNEAYEEIRDILNPEGHFIFYAPHPHGLFYGSTSLWETDFDPNASYTDNFPFKSKILMADGTTRRGSGYHHQLAEYTADLNRHGLEIVDMQEFFAKGDRVPHALVIDAKIGDKK